MYIDVLIQTIHWTGLIDNESDDLNPLYSEGFSNTPPTELTFDQESKAYVRFMSTGPLRLLVELSKYKFGNAMWAALKQSEFYHLFIQRLLRICGRETLSTHDGVKLGPMVRKILLQVLPGIQLEHPIRGKSTVDDLLLQTRRSPCQFLGPKDDITAEIINTMFLLELEDSDDSD